MAVTLVSTGVKFPDNTIQTSAASGLPAIGSMTTTTSSGRNGTYLGNGGGGWYYFSNFNKGNQTLSYVEGWKTKRHSPYNNMHIETGPTGGLFWANGTPRLNTTYYSYNSGSGYSGATIKWRKL